jgi:hypothetical protein
VDYNIQKKKLRKTHDISIKNTIPNEEIPSHWLLRQLWPTGVALPLRLAKDAAARLRL